MHLKHLSFLIQMFWAILCTQSFFIFCEIVFLPWNSILFNTPWYKHFIGWLLLLFFLGTFKFSVCYFDTRSCHKWREETENGAIAQRDVYNNFKWHIRCVLNKCTATVVLRYDWCDLVLWSMIQWHNFHCNYTEISTFWCVSIL